jgi:26S proteasome regulatory subunit N9
VANKVNNPNSQDAYVYAIVAAATVKLELKNLEGARKDLDKAEKILDSFDSVETIVHAAFYRVNAEYYQVRLITLAGRASINNTSLNSNLPSTTETLSFT